MTFIGTEDVHVTFSGLKDTFKLNFKAGLKSKSSLLRHHKCHS